MTDTQVPRDSNMVVKNTENVFLFIPNIIGKSVKQWVADSSLDHSVD